MAVLRCWAGGVARRVGRVKNAAQFPGGLVNAYSKSYEILTPRLRGRCMVTTGV